MARRTGIAPHREPLVGVLGPALGAPLFGAGGLPEYKEGGDGGIRTRERSTCQKSRLDHSRTSPRIRDRVAQRRTLRPSLWYLSGSPKVLGLAGRANVTRVTSGCQKSL